MNNFFDDEFDGEEHEDGTAPSIRHKDDHGSYRKVSKLNYSELCEIVRLHALDWNVSELATWFEVSENEITRVIQGFKPSHK